MLLFFIFKQAILTSRFKKNDCTSILLPFIALYKKHAKAFHFPKGHAVKAIIQSPGNLLQKESLIRRVDMG